MNQPPSNSQQIGSNGVAPEDFYRIAMELQNLVYPEPAEFGARRSHQRLPRSISVSLQPLDDDFRPTGERIWVVSRDISPNGVGLISYRKVECEYLRIGLLNEQVWVLGRHRHNTAIGKQYPLYLVGVEFQDQWSILSR